MNQFKHTVSGFTLIELVTTLMVLAILGAGVIGFISDSTNGFSTTVARAQLAEDAQYLIGKFSDEIREALPNSIRANARCLEFVPVEGGSKYHTLPIGSGSSGFYSWPIDPWPLSAWSSGKELRVVVYPQPDLYELTNPGAISPTSTISSLTADNRQRINFDTTFAFSTGSPKASYFLVSEPVSYCTVGDNLYRYSNYGYRATQPVAATLPSALPNRALAGEGITAIFSIAPTTLLANSIVTMNVSLSARGETIAFNHQAHIRNAP